MRRLCTSAAAAPPVRRAGVFRRIVLPVGVVAAAGLGAAGTYIYVKDEGTRRSVKFWWHCFPIFLHYKWVQWSTKGKPDQEIDDAYQVLHVKYSAKVEALTWEMRGFYLKLTQTVSTRDDLIPPEYMVWAKKTQDAVPVTMTSEQAKAIVANDLGQPVDDVFAEWNDTPVGTASIGQVYRARLKNGKEVAVKVQMPGIERLFRSDLNTVIAFCRVAMPQHVKALQEIYAQFETEFDYRLEARNLQEISDNVMPVWGHKVRVPRPVLALCTHDVLVMDYLHGVRLVDGIRRQYSQVAERLGKTLEELEAEQKAKSERVVDDARWVSFKTTLLRASMRAVDVAENAGRVAYNWTVGWVATPVRYRWRELPIDLGRVITLLNHVHAHEIFIDGAFNGDPHPGNVLLMPDGRLGLIDYGQVKHIDLHTRLTYAKLIIALARDDADEVVRLFRDEVGVRTKTNDFDILWRMAAFWNDRDTHDVTMGMNVQVFMDYMEGRDPTADIPGDYVMATRVSVLLRGMALAFGIHSRTSLLWRGYAERVLREHGVQYPPGPTATRTRHIDTSRDLLPPPPGARAPAA